jgi:hypothetical protein
VDELDEISGEKRGGDDGLICGRLHRSNWSHGRS